jgi:hypothetical protein
MGAQLSTLLLSRNELSGSLPTGMSTLTRLDLSSNRFIGTIPASAFPGMRQLVQFAVANNSLVGSIPDSIR